MEWVKRQALIDPILIKTNPDEAREILHEKFNELLSEVIPFINSIDDNEWIIIEIKYKEKEDSFL